MSITSPRAVYKCDKLSMEVLETYASANEADRAHGLGYGHVANCAKRRTVSFGPYVWRYADDYDPAESFEGKKNRPVAMLDTATHAAAVFTSPSAAAKAVGVPSGDVCCSIARKWAVRGRYVFKYMR